MQQYYPQPLNNPGKIVCKTGILLQACTGYGLLTIANIPAEGKAVVALEAPASGR
jgi:hypothetical protein